MWYAVESNKRMCELLKAQGNLDSTINKYRVQLSHTRIECVQYSFNDWVCINFVFGFAIGMYIDYLSSQWLKLKLHRVLHCIKFMLRKLEENNIFWWTDNNM